MKTRRCRTAHTQQRLDRPNFKPGDIVSYRDSFRATHALEALQNRFSRSTSNSGITKLFRCLDFDNNGYITAGDLLRLIETHNVPLGTFDCHALMTKLDKAKTGSVNLGEFTRALSGTDGSFLDQLQRTIIGVTRNGGTVYKNHYAESVSTTGRSLDSGNRVMNIMDAVEMGVKGYRAPTGRLDQFFHDLVIPHRNVPWFEDTRRTVEPARSSDGCLNSHHLSDRARHTTSSLNTFNQPTDSNIPQVADKLQKQKRSQFSKSQYRDLSRGAQEMEGRAHQQDLERVAFATASLKDYHNRVNRPMCHVL